MLALYKLPRNFIVQKVNEGLKNELKEEDIFTEVIKISHLKKIDKIFNKGLLYYIDPKDPPSSKEESIFFRKDKFNVELNLAAKKVVNRFEEEKILYNSYAKLTEININRILPFYKITDNPEVIGLKTRSIINPIVHFDYRHYLIELMNCLSNFNILVFEFVETWNQIETANINGFYIQPNVIVLKRNQYFLNREIFTLCHELGHYLLNNEEIDDLNEESFNVKDNIENWCNRFAFSFLAGDEIDLLRNAENATPENNYQEKLIKEFAERTRISLTAIYTWFLDHEKINNSGYFQMMKLIKNRISERERLAKERAEKEKMKLLEDGRKPSGGPAHPIVSRLHSEILKAAYLSGLMNEYEIRNRLSNTTQTFESLFE